MSRVEVPMPQMGESIAEGTVSKWLKSVGDTIERDEPILEISTDKVDAEIPAPAAGTLVAIEVQEGETVEVGTVVAFIDTEGGAPDAVSPAEASGPASTDTLVVTSAPPQPAMVSAPTPGPQATVAPPDSGAVSVEERIRTRSTPVVRKIAAEHGIDITALAGTGHAGRVTKQDILAYIASGAVEAAPAERREVAELASSPSPDSVVRAAPRAPPSAPPAAVAPSAPTSELGAAFYSEVEHPEVPIRANDRVEPMDKIRRLTAEHMVLAKRVAPHVHSFIEIDFTRVDQIRRENKGKWVEQGARVSFTAFVVWACSRVLPDFPMVNGTVSGNNLVFRGEVNLGIAVDLNPGLIVPVIKNADDLSLVGIGRRIMDLAARARSRRLTPDEIQGGTFSITNPGVLGTLVGMPVIPKGTSAILGTGAIEKRPVVVQDPVTGADAIAIRKRCIFSLGYDHRIVDGADAARFLARLKELIEDFPDDA